MRSGRGGVVGLGHNVVNHYSRGDLLLRLNAALADDGVDPSRPQIDTLAPYDQFHGRGLEATQEIAAMLKVAPTDHLLDVGSGIGGPARYMAHRFGCRVTGIDLTAEYCEAARYGEVRRVLRPGSWLMLSELAKGPGAPLDYPTPWAATASTSFLATPEETRNSLEAAGFEIVQFRKTTEAVKSYGARSRAMVDRGEKPPHRAVQLMHGDIAPLAMKNTVRGVAEGSIIPVEILSRKRG